MKRSFFLLCAVLFVLGSLLPLAGYRLTKTVLGPAAPASSAAAPEPETPDAASPPPSDRDSETFLIADQGDGAVVSVPRRDYLIGAVAAEMPRILSGPIMARTSLPTMSLWPTWTPSASHASARSIASFTTKGT